MTSSEPRFLPVLTLVQNSLADVVLPVQIPLEEFDAHDKIYIGSDHKCQIQIPSIQVSRIHAIIKRRKVTDDPPSHPQEEIYSYFLVDYSCGLRLNSLPINRNTEVRIQSGDLIDLVPAFSLRLKFDLVDGLPKKVTHLELENSRLLTQIESLQTELEEKQSRLANLTIIGNGVADLLWDNERLTAALDRMQDQKEFQVLSILKTEYSCAICNGVFIDPTSLPCGHTFCTHCLRQWLSQKNECPFCREPCIGMNNPKKNVSISSMIEKIYEELLSSEDVRTNRADALKEREEEVKMAATAVSLIPAPPSFEDEYGRAMRRIAPSFEDEYGRAMRRIDDETDLLRRHQYELIQRLERL